MMELTGEDMSCNTLKLSLLGSKHGLANFGIYKKQFVSAVLLEKFFTYPCLLW